MLGPDAAGRTGRRTAARRRSCRTKQVLPRTRHRQPPRAGALRARRRSSVQLPAHKRILTYDISLEPLPRTTTGKIRRHEMERAARERAARRRRTTRVTLTRTTSVRWLRSDRRRRAAAGRRHRHAARPRRPSRPDANLELDLGLDSMERVELLTLLEQQAGTRVAADVRADDLHRAPARRRGARGAAASRSERPDVADARLRAAGTACSRCPPTRTSSRTCAGRSAITAVVLFVATQIVALVRADLSGASGRGVRPTCPPAARSSSARTI